MDATLYQSVQRLLSSKEIEIASDYIAEKLMRHPDYPSAWCVSEVLNDLGLESVVVKIEKHLLDEIPFPFLAHVKTNGGEFVLIDSLKKLKKVRKNFEEIWDGIVLAVEAPDGWKHSTGEEPLANKIKNTQLRNYSLLTFSALATTYFLLNFNWVLFLAFLVSSFGLIFAWSGACNELGISNKVAEQFCGSSTTCRNSGTEKTKKILGMGFSDLAMSWFLISVLILIIVNAAQMQGLASILFVASLFSLLVIPVSVYLQWRIHKEWCPICLAILGSVFCQFLVLSFGIQTSELVWPKFDEVILFVLTCLSTVLIWTSYRTTKEKQLKESVEKNHAYKLYFNKDIFTSLLRISLPLDVSPFENEIQVGNKNAALQITVVSNPFCGPCAHAHQLLDELLDIYDFGLQVRFVLSATDASDDRTKVVHQILRNLIPHLADRKYCRKVLNTWFANSKLDRFAKQYPGDCDVDTYSSLVRHEEWAMYANIRRTPAILIDGYHYPDLYRVEDLRELIPLILKAQSSR